MTMRITRREGLLPDCSAAALGPAGASSTGLPAWYLLNPRRATAQDLQCAITARENLQYLILSVSSNGDPLNCNCPGTYEAPTIVHPTQTEVEQVPLTLGGQTYGAALPWADPSVMSPTDMAMGVATPATGQLSRSGARADRVLPPPHRHHRPRRPAQGDEAARRHERRRDGRVRVREAPVHLLRHRAGGADRGRRARQLQRAGQLRGPHAAVDLADAAQAAADRVARPTRW